MIRVNDILFIRDYISLENKKQFEKRIYEILNLRLGKFNKKETIIVSKEIFYL